MSKLFKLTKQDWTTCNDTLWGPGVEHEARGSSDQRLCTNGWIHAYTDKLLAVLLNPIHANIQNPVLWECDGVIEKTDYGLKVGCRKIKTIRIIPYPDVSIEQRIRFSILCAKAVCKNPKWTQWADYWLSGKRDYDCSLLTKWRMGPILGFSETAAMTSEIAAEHADNDLFDTASRAAALAAEAAAHAAAEGRRSAWAAVAAAEAAIAEAKLHEDNTEREDARAAESSARLEAYEGIARPFDPEEEAALSKADTFDLADIAYAACGGQSTEDY